MTFANILATRLRHEPGRPLVTFYDDATGERVELSVTTYANWVAKASSLLLDELGLDKGDGLYVDLPPHWLTTVFLGAAWNGGLVVTDSADIAEAVVCGPATLADYAGTVGERTVLACSLLPLGVRFPDGVPEGVHDVGVEIWSQPDEFTAWDTPLGEDAALSIAGALITQEAVWRAATAGELIPDGGRLLTDANPASPPGVATLCEPLARGGSLVLVAQAAPSRLEEIAVSEQVTNRFPA
ncbi:TIGR03089 family protein [Nocardioides sp. BGMRC 2183]|nr:TIGR03089 family protein [Nocardioides sp. BGMRC 2183]